jgi:hypothetical protein
MATRGKRSPSDEKATFWHEHVAKWRTSGLSQAAYCREAGVSNRTFGYWKRRLEQELSPSSPSVVAIELSDVFGPSLGPTQTPLRLCLGDRFAVEISGDFCSPVLEKLVRTLEGLA